MKPEQFDLVNRATAPWLTLWMVTDFDAARNYAVGTSAAGTWRDESGNAGQYETTSKGMSAWQRGSREHPAVTVTWREVERWSAGLTVAARASAAALRTEHTELQRSYPPAYPGIGRAYAWDITDSTPEQREADLKALREANARRDVEVTAWQERRREYNQRVKTFLDSIRPTREPDLFDVLNTP